jgi:transcription elongation factor Elf1
MLNPEDFIKIEKEELSDLDIDLIDISGTFICPLCQNSVNDATLNLSNNKIKYRCDQCDEEIEAKL